MVLLVAHVTRSVSDFCFRRPFPIQFSAFQCALLPCFSMRPPAADGQAFVDVTLALQRADNITASIKLVAIQLGN